MNKDNRLTSIQYLNLFYQINKTIKSNNQGKYKQIRLKYKVNYNIYKHSYSYDFKINILDQQKIFYQ